MNWHRGKPSTMLAGRWFWVKREGGIGFLAQYQPNHPCNNWTNGDTWEDFDNEVVYFAGPIEEPK